MSRRLFNYLAPNLKIQPNQSLLPLESASAYC